MIARPAVRRGLATVSRARLFHTSRVAYVKVGDRLPDLADALMENSPGNKINLAQELSSGRGLIIGVPAAFSPSCSASHIPGYISHPKLASAGKTFVVSVNDVFVMKAWANTLDAKGTSGLRFLGDPSSAFTSALDVGFENIPIFGGIRSKRYALVVENGIIKSVHIEPDNTGVNVSSAKTVLG